MLEPFVAAARDYVRRTVGVELDGSDTSLAYIDHYLERTRAGGDLKDEVVRLVAPALGAYLGEVLLGRFGGRWVLGEDPGAWRIELEPAELSFSPVAMAAEALRHDEVPGFDASLKTRPSLHGPLAEALAAVPPVEEDYYFSLTGRFETIEHAVELLVELDRREKEEKAEQN